MKKIGTISVIAIVAICLTIISGFDTISEVSAVNGEGNSTISVSGTGVIETEPNQAKVYLGVETHSANVTEALETNSVKMDSVIDALEKLGVPKDSIETSYFSIYPLKDYEERREEIIGYQVTNEITVELSDLGEIGKVIDTAIDSGANKVSRIEFGLSEVKEEELRQKALKEACEDARTKADAIASGLGLQIIRVSTAREGGVYIQPYRAGGFYESVMAMSTPMPMSIPPPIEPKEVTVSATIDIVYECR